MRSACHPCLFRACLAGWLAALVLASGCSRAPQTVELQTDKGSETVAAPTPATLFAMARMFETEGRHAESAGLLNQLLSAHPDYLPAYGELANLLARQGRLEQARDVLQAGLKKAPRDPVLLNDLGMCHLLMRQYPPAQEDFQQACEAAPADLRCRANLALASGLNGDLKKAQTLYATFLSAAETERNLEIIRKTRLAEAHPSGAAQAPALLPGHPALPPNLETEGKGERTR